MKRLLLLGAIFSVFQIVAQQVLPEKDLLWEVSSPNGKQKAYLFGTLHSNERNLFQLADSVYWALDKAPLVVLETDICALFDELDPRTTLPSTKIDQRGQAYTSELESTQTVYGSEDGMPQFLDAYLQVYALNAAKKVLALESIHEQYAMTDEYKLGERKLIDNAINDFTHEKLTELYLRGDIDGLERFMKANLSLQENLYEEVIVKRNLKMALELDSILKAKQVFFCAVGAGHLGGTQGIIQLLRSKGYRVRPMAWTISERDTEAEKRVKKANEYLFQDAKSGLVAKLPGKPVVESHPDGSQRIIYRELGQGNTYEINLMPLDSNTTEEELASIYIASPDGAPMLKRFLDDGSVVFEGLSDTYPEGLNYVQIQFSTQYFAVVKVYGGNKFMHSNRPKLFFERVWFDE
ncbi:MAG: hypothetical protein RLZZ301_765 [Bacteroidota bacterium]|jgi:uncharacterized protein YbaP (TraB family)